MGRPVSLLQQARRDTAGVGAGPGGVEVSGTDLDSPSVGENQDEFAGALQMVES